MRGALVLVLVASACGSDPAAGLPDAPLAPDAGAPDGAPAPALVSIEPADGATAVEPDVAIVATFSAAVDPAEVSLSLATDGAVIDGVVSVDGARVTFLPVRRLGLRARHQISVAGAVSAFTVRDGELGPVQPAVTFEETGGHLYALRGSPLEGALALTSSWSSGASFDGMAVRLSRLGETAGEPEIVDDPGDDADCEEADLAVDAAGRATVFEHRALPAGNEAYLRTSDVAGAWSERTPVSMFGDGAYGVQAAPDGSGGTLLLWMKLDGGLNSVWASRFQPGVGVDLPAVIETEGGEVGDLRLAGSPGGRAVAAWSRHETPALADVYANVYTPGLGWGTARRLDPDDAETAFQPDVGVGPHTVIVWAHANVPHARVNTAGQGWGPVEPLADHTDADRPVVAVSASGHAVAVWTRKGTKPFADLWAARYLPGEGWQTAEIIDSEDLGHAQQPSVALDAHGEGMVVWRQSDGSHTNVWGNRLSQTTGWRGAQRLDEEDTAADDPRVVADGRGQLFVVWQQDAPHRLLMRVVR